MSAENPPIQSGKQQVPDPLQPPAGQAPPVGFLAPSPVPPPYYGYYGPPGARLNQGPILQPPQPIIITTVQPRHEPDYLAYSIFTLICCCLPLGIAAVIYSVQTREANKIGDTTAAQQNSRLARILAHTALGIGIAFIIVCIIIAVTTGF